MSNSVSSDKGYAVIYCRVSSTKQTVEGSGLSSQEANCREFARQRGLEVLEVFTDDISGKHRYRPGMTAMLAFLRQARSLGVFVIIDDITRLARDMAVHLDLRAAIKNAGATLVSPKMEFNDKPASILVEGMLAMTSQFQRLSNSDQVRDRMFGRLMGGYWPFKAPVGFCYSKAKGGGHVLVRDEPLASVIQEALEGYASGRFEKQTDVARFLEASPLFPKVSGDRVLRQRATDILKNYVYAGLVGCERWKVAARQGNHEGLIGLDVYQRIQDRLNGRDRVPARKNVNRDFALRGFVACGHCSTPLRSCWSKGSHGSHAYYLCQTKGCASYGKSIRRDVIEGEFEELLKTARPTEGLFRIAGNMFREMWDNRGKQAADRAKMLADELAKVERNVASFLDRIVDAQTPSVIAKYEERIAALERSKLEINARRVAIGKPLSSFDTAARTAMAFLANPWKLWASGDLEDRRTVLKLTFAGRMQYV
ncbi:MAG: recombinase family protein [Burkholderiales bacterium]